MGVLAPAASASPAFQLRADVTLHLYISEAPCGDAAVTLTAPDSPGGVWSGSKPLRWAIDRISASPALPSPPPTPSPGCSCSDIGVSCVPVARGLCLACIAGEVVAPTLADDAAGTHQAPGIPRTKPVRSDIPPQHMTACMSCSDKITKWLHVGLQGSALSLLLPAPLPLASITVHPIDDNTAEDVLKARLAALTRAVQGRCPAARCVALHPLPTPFFLCQAAVQQRCVRCAHLCSWMCVPYDAQRVCVRAGWMQLVLASATPAAMQTRLRVP